MTDSLQSRTIDYLRFLMAFAVVLLHASSAGANGDYPVYSTLCILLAQGICRVAVPCFFLISGFLFFKGLERWDWQAWTRKVGRRVHTLLIPFLLWNLLAAALIYGYNWLRVRFGSADAASLTELTATWGGCGWRIFWNCQEGMPLDYPLWFIRDLILLTAASPLVYALCRYLKGFGLLLLAVLLFGFLHKRVDLFFYVLGAFLSLSGRDLSALARRVKWPAVGLTVVLLCLLPMSFRHRPELYFYLLNLMKFSGCAAAFALVGAGLDKGLLHNRPFLTRSSFFIFAAHGILVLDDFARYFMLHVTSSRGELYYCSDIFVRTLLTVGFCLLLFRLGERFLPGVTDVLTGARAKKRLV